MPRRPTPHIRTPASGTPRTEDAAARTASDLAALGYRQPEAIAERLKAMRGGGRYREMPARKPGAARPAGAARDRSGGRRAGARRDARARARPARRGEPARLLPRAARGVPAGVETARRADAREPLGRAVSHPASHTARRAARHAHALRGARLDRARRAPRRGARRDRRRHREADGRAPALQERAHAALHRAGPRRTAAGGDTERSPERSRRRDPRSGHAARVEERAPGAPRGPALRRDRLRQARRQGARLRLGSRRRVPLRRPGPGGGGKLRAPRPARELLADDHSPRPACSTRPTCGCVPTGRADCW